MKFKTAFYRGETTFSELGSETAPIYEYRINKKTGKRISVQTGETNIYEKIQASLESTKLENIIARCTNGDITLLSARNGNYIDISEIPTNMMELQNTILKAKSEFEKLPSEIKAKFDYSAEKYVSEYGTKSWQTALGLINENQPLDKKTTETVKEQKEVTANE